MGRLSLAAEAVEFLGRNKKLWMLPIIAVLTLLGLALAAVEGSALAPFLYTVF